MSRGRRLYHSQLHVPLIWRRRGSDPAVEQGLRVGRVVRHVDVMPTLLERVGVEGQPGTEQIEGESLADALAGAPDSIPDDPEAFAQRRTQREHWIQQDVLSLQVGELKCIRRYETDDALFDLGRDPTEQENLAGAMPDVAAKMRGRLVELYESFESEGEELRSGHDEQTNDEETLEELRTLGYVNRRDALRPRSAVRRTG